MQLLVFNNAEPDAVVWGASELSHADKFSNSAAEKKSEIEWRSIVI